MSTRMFISRASSTRGSERFVLGCVVFLSPVRAGYLGRATAPRGDFILREIYIIDNDHGRHVAAALKSHFSAVIIPAWIPLTWCK